MGATHRQMPSELACWKTAWKFHCAHSIFSLVSHSRTKLFHRRNVSPLSTLIDEGPYIRYRENKLTFISPLDLIGPQIAETTTSYLFDAFNAATGSGSTSIIKWTKATEAERDQGILLHISVTGTPKQITWHRRGDYFASVAPDGLFGLFDQLYLN